MRVLLDENMDRRLKTLFDADFEVLTVKERGWAGRKNGVLIRSAEEEFDALVTMDRSIEEQQNLSTLKMGIIVVVARSNRRADVAGLIPSVNRVLRNLHPGDVVHVSA
jgi:hypothetical protein